MAGEVVAPAITIFPEDSLYRGIHPMYYQQGQLLSGVFCLNKKHKIEDGPSVGIAKLIVLKSFHSLIAVDWGVGEFLASAPLSLSLAVHCLPDSAWGEFANAHAVITDYQKLTDKDRGNAQRALRDALQKNIVIKPQERTTGQ